MKGSNVILFVRQLFLLNGKNGTMETKGFVGRSKIALFRFNPLVCLMPHRSDAILSANPDMRYDCLYLILLHQNYLLLR